jgi:hypothetical protein
MASVSNVARLAPLSRGKIDVLPFHVRRLSTSARQRHQEAGEITQTGSTVASGGAHQSKPTQGSRS